MEQDCVAGVYQSLGMSVRAEFSSEDVSLLYSKVFHIPSNTDEAHKAMKKIAGGDNSWSCVGENVLDVLLEMEREREKKEKLYWDLQLLNAGNLNNLHMKDKPLIIDPCVTNCLHQSSDPNTFKKACNSDTGSLHSCATDAASLQMGRLVGKNNLNGRVRGAKRLNKAARQCWSRLASEGVQSILPSPWQGQCLRVKSQAWGCVSLSDILLLVEVKYDVITHWLYTEMLQKYHAPDICESSMPWQQHEEEEVLQELAEKALESGDMLRLAELPGALRLYRACLGASCRGCTVSREQSWSAASLLYELHKSHHRERDTLTVLAEGMDREGLRLLCLYIRLATLRAQREKQSYSAFLAARQSWEMWPHVNSPCRAEQAALWLRGEEEEQSKDVISLSPQQAVLQLLVLTQEKERKHLVKLVHGVSPEDLEGPSCTVPPKDNSQKQTVLRNGCIKRLRQIHTTLQTHKETQTPLEQTNCRPQFQPQPQMQAHIHNEPAAWSREQLEDCALLLLTHLLELQDVQVSELLLALMDKSAQHLQLLRDEYEAELQEQRNTNLLQLLISDAPLPSGSMLIPNTNLSQTQSCSTGAAMVQNVIVEPAEVSAVASVNGADRDVQAADVDNKQDFCTGCGAVTEEMPYLEILCVSDAASATYQSLIAEGGAQEEEGSSATKSSQSYEKQGSLITLAWSQPPEDDIDYEAETSDGGTGQSPGNENSVRTQVQPGDMSNTVEYTQGEEISGESNDEELKPASFQSVSTGHCDARSPEKEYSTEIQSPFEEWAVDHPQREKAASDLFTDPPEAEPHTDDLCSGMTNDRAEFGRDTVEVDSGLAARGAMGESTLMERERVREPVSAVEREKTMRNLVDMQRKVEQKQQRDKERQLLRVQERLSIIQNRKAEEDLLGLKHTDRLKHLTQDLPQEDKNQQKTAVRERLEQLRRERSYVMQSKRDRNTAGFKELLGPVALHSRETEDGVD